MTPELALILELLRVDQVERRRALEAEPPEALAAIRRARLAREKVRDVASRMTPRIETDGPPLLLRFEPPARKRKGPIVF